MADKVCKYIYVAYVLESAMNLNLTDPGPYIQYDVLNQMSVTWMWRLERKI